MKKRVADIIIETLIDNGITDAFCVVGGGSMFLDNAAGINPNMNIVFNNHEQACAMACEGYYRTSGKMALCLVTSGPGGTNTLTGVMGAYQDSIPMIIVSGQVRYATTVAQSGLSLRRRGEQEFDIVNSVQNMTKYAKMVIDPLSIRQEVQHAIDIALNGRRGPVWLDIPLDVQSAMVEENELLPNIPKPEIIKCSDKDFEELKELIKNAKAPCILAGSAISSTHSQNKLEKLLAKWKIPVVSAICMSDVLANDTELFYGGVGGLGTRAGNFIMQSADLLIVLGCSLGYKQTTFSQEVFAPEAKIVMIDVNPDEAKKEGLNIFKFIQSDIADIFNKVDKSEQYTAPKVWLEHCAGLKSKFEFFENANHDMASKVNSYNFWKEYTSQISKDNITILGNSSSMTAGWQYGKDYKSQIRFTNANCGSMGYDLPAAVGACVGSNTQKSREIILVTGDGSFMMNLQELQTIKTNRVPLKIILFCNNGYGGIVQTCKNYFNGYNVGCTPDSGIKMPDFEKIANAFEFHYKKCDCNGKLKECINWLLNHDGNCLLELVQAENDTTAPVVKPRLKENGETEKLKLEDMFPFLDRNVYNECIFKS